MAQYGRGREVGCRGRDRSLYDWTWRQRNNLRQNKLSLERELLLDEIGFVWEPRAAAGGGASGASGGNDVNGANDGSGGFPTRRMT